MPCDDNDQCYLTAPSQRQNQCGLTINLRPILHEMPKVSIHETSPKIHYKIASISLRGQRVYNCLEMGHMPANNIEFVTILAITLYPRDVLQPMKTIPHPGQLAGKHHRWSFSTYAEILLGISSANERWHIVTSSLIGWAYSVWSLLWFRALWATGKFCICRFLYQWLGVWFAVI